MKLPTVIVASIIWLLSGAAAWADSVILIHGYLGSANSWRTTGTARILQRRGWPDGGHLRLGPGGIHLFRGGPPSPRRFYTVNLPSEAPIALQGNMLTGYMNYVAARHPNERLVLVGHSAGGIVARFAQVTTRGAKAAALITIASPHMGTEMAQLGSAIANSPLSFVAPFFGGSTINRSRSLYRDLSPERPGNLLGWLNRQPHPAAQYVSIIRTNNPASPAAGDSFVPGWSQDMNSTPALRGKSRRIFSPGDHGLRPGDGHLIANILSNLKR